MNIDCTGPFDPQSAKNGKKVQCFLGSLKKNHSVDPFGAPSKTKSKTIDFSL